ncbi:MAG: hypothetical protein M1834_002832 [Cirrosporium novae-zelandiae]|nr:MAG: hypothetical protein M1834_002832 [Cirrosporium novae-zelandiae]
MAGKVRQPIDVGSLERYLDQHIPAIKTPLEVKQFGYGQSNPTYLLTTSTGSKFVLRKKPPGTLFSKTAHKVEREYRIIHALDETDVPVPKTYCLCEDDNVIGTPFYIMEFLDGRIFEQPWFPNVSIEERTEMWRSAIITLAKLHRISPSSVGLSSFGKPSGFYNRQLATFGTLSVAQSKAEDVDTGVPVGPIPHFNKLVEVFKQEEMQPEDRATIVHGDYKIDNLVYHKTEPRVIGILDWEMSTIGHPLSDLANLLTPFLPHPMFSRSQRDSHTLPQAFRPLPQIPGLPARPTLLTLYTNEVQTWDPHPDMSWGDAFGIFRGAIICQGIAARSARRQASSAKAGMYGVLVAPYGEWAWGLVEKMKKERAEQMGKAKL